MDGLSGWMGFSSWGTGMVLLTGDEKHPMVFFVCLVYICCGFLHHVFGIIDTNMSFWIFPVFSDERWNKDIFLKCTVLWRL